MGLLRRKKKELWQEEPFSFEDRMAELRKSLEELRGPQIEVLTKCPGEDSSNNAVELKGYKTKPGERVILGHEFDAKDFGYDKCPNCGIYGVGDVKTCLCGYEFKNF